MFAKKILISALMVAGTLGAIVMPLPSVAAVDVYVNFGPPPDRYEVVPAPRHGYVWAPGYWDYRGHKHHWVKGAWVRERPGYYYEPTRWVAHDGRWRLERSRWNHGDRDRDGIPNSRDRDRDGDGVPNNRDARPDNPNWR